jgi:hypothetical protein
MPKCWTVLLPKGSYLKLLVLCLVIIQLMCISLFSYNSGIIQYSSNDREVLLGRFLMSEKSTNFSFEAFKSEVNFFIVTCKQKPLKFWHSGLRLTKFCVEKCKPNIFCFNPFWTFVFFFVLNHVYNFIDLLTLSCQENKIYSLIT